MQNSQRNLGSSLSFTKSRTSLRKQSPLKKKEFIKDWTSSRKKNKDEVYSQGLDSHARSLIKQMNHNIKEGNLLKAKAAKLKKSKGRHYHLNFS